MPRSHPFVPRLALETRAPRPGWTLVRDDINLSHGLSALAAMRGCPGMTFRLDDEAPYAVMYVVPGGGRGGDADGDSGEHGEAASAGSGGRGGSPVDSAATQ